MNWLRFHTRLLLLAACMCLAGQGVVAFASVWHHHDEAPVGQHHDGCAICAAVSETGQPVDAAVPAPAPEFVCFAPVIGQPLPAFLVDSTPIKSRGPPSTPAV